MKRWLVMGVVSTVVGLVAISAILLLCAGNGREASTPVLGLLRLPLAAALVLVVVLQIHDAVRD